MYWFSDHVKFLNTCAVVPSDWGTFNKDKSDNLQDVANRVWEKVSELREEGKLPEITEEDLVNEPTALAFTPYEVEDEIEGSIDDVVDETIPQTDEVITLSEKDSEIFMDEIDNPKEPNDIIKNALEKYKQSRSENTIINQPYKQSKTNIKRID